MTAQDIIQARTGLAQIEQVIAVMGQDGVSGECWTDVAAEVCRGVRQYLDTQEARPQPHWWQWAWWREQMTAPVLPVSGLSRSPLPLQRALLCHGCGVLHERMPASGRCRCGSTEVRSLYRELRFLHRQLARFQRKTKEFRRALWAGDGRLARDVTPARTTDECRIAPV